MRIYLASSYERRNEMRGVRDVLVAMEHDVTSQWLDQWGGDLARSASSHRLTHEPAYGQPYALVEIDDLERSDTLFEFTGPDGHGIEHVALGFALARKLRIVVVGPRLHVLHCLPEIEHHATWRELAAQLSATWNNERREKR